MQKKTSMQDSMANKVRKRKEGRKREGEEERRGKPKEKGKRRIALPGVCWLPSSSGEGWQRHFARARATRALTQPATMKNKKKLTSQNA